MLTIKNISKKNYSTIFKKIINREIGSNILYETDRVIVIKDIAPVAPIHLLIIPKKEIESISKSKEEDINILGELMSTARILADKFNIKDGFRIVINDGKHGCQSVNHLHLHFIAGKQLGWPPGTDVPNTKI